MRYLFLLLLSLPAWAWDRHDRNREFRYATEGCEVVQQCGEFCQVRRGEEVCRQHCTRPRLVCEAPEPEPTPEPDNPGSEMVAIDFSGGRGLIREADFVGNEKGIAGTAAFWFKVKSGDGEYRFIYASSPAASNGLTIQLNPLNQIAVRGYYNSGTHWLGTLILRVRTTTTFPAGGGWNHIAASWKQDGSVVPAIYVNGVEDSEVLENTAGELNYTHSYHTIGFRAGLPQYHFGGCLAQFYLNLRERVDLSTNIHKFYNNGPVVITNGSDVTGTAPAVFINGLPAVNLGSGGEFAASGGELTPCT